MVFCQNTFVLSSVGPVHPYWRETISRLHTEKLSRNRQLQENMESRENLFWGRPQYAPPCMDVSINLKSIHSHETNGFPDEQTPHHHHAPHRIKNTRPQSTTTPFRIPPFKIVNDRAFPTRLRDSATIPPGGWRRPNTSFLT